LSGKVHKEPEFKQKIITDLGQLESVERRWLTGILAGIIVASINCIIFLSHLGEVLAGQPVRLDLIQFSVVFITTTILLIASVAAFAEYFSLELRVSVGRGMIIKKRRGSKGRSEDEAPASEG
jgi:ethanolamine transporter EutH